MYIAEKDTSKLDTQNRFCSIKLTLLCFRFTNAPASFFRLIAGMLQSLNGKGLVQFLDDILVHSRSVEERNNDPRELHRILQNNRIYVRSSKCNIEADKIESLEVNVGSKNTYTPQCLVIAVSEWPTTTIIHEVRQLIGFTFFYRRFIFRFAGIVQSTTNLRKERIFIGANNKKMSS